MTRSRLGVLTIGQAPRVDLVPEMARHWPGVELLERGALDDLDPEVVRSHPIREGDEVLTSRMRDGSSAVFGRELVMRHLQSAISTLEGEGADAVLLVCTGTFPGFQHSKPLYLASPLLVRGVQALANGPIGVIAPLPEQQTEAAEKFTDLRVLTSAADPYRGTAEELRAAARALADQGATMLVLDCMGYTEQHRQTVKSAVAELPVVVARSLVARLVAEAVAG